MRAMGAKVAGLSPTTISVNILAIASSEIEINAPTHVKSTSSNLSSKRGKIAFEALASDPNR